METKKLLYILGGVVLLGVVAYFVWTNLKKDNASFPESTTSTESMDGETSGGTSKKPSSTSLPATKRYLDAIKVYKTTGYYFQFSKCSGMPGSLTLKKGVKFMLDNRDGVAHKIAIQGGQSFNVGAYDFAIATAPSKIGTHYITCDGGGAAKIVVQN